MRELNLEAIVTPSVRPSDQRISNLSDMICVHLTKHRVLKALRIAQYLRQVTGCSFVRDLQLTGYRKAS